MFKPLLTALAISALIASAPAAAQGTDKSPATAPPAAAAKSADQTTALDCTADNMAKGHSMMMGMPDGEKKTMGMQEMTMANDMMEKKDMAGCKTHMNKGMGMGMGMGMSR